MEMAEEEMFDESLSGDGQMLPYPLPLLTVQE